MDVEIRKRYQYRYRTMYRWSHWFRTSGRELPKFRCPRGEREKDTHIFVVKFRSCAVTIPSGFILTSLCRLLKGLVAGTANTARRRIGRLCPCTWIWGGTKSILAMPSVHVQRSNVVAKSDVWPPERMYISVSCPRTVWMLSGILVSNVVRLSLSKNLLKPHLS